MKLPDLPIADAMSRGRQDPCFFSHYFLNRRLHDGQAEYVNNAEATINVLACANRYGKTTLLATRHFWRAMYKVGAEPRYLDDEGVLDLEAYLHLRYLTVHTAGLWEIAALVWQDCLQIISENERIQPFVKDQPRTLPPHITFTNGAKILFRTLGDKGEGIDGKSFYYVSIDEAGWVKNLEEILNNVGRIRVADVRGVIDIVGTFKPGTGRDFYTYANRAAVHTGRKIGFDHRDGRDYFTEFDYELGRVSDG